MVENDVNELTIRADKNQLGRYTVTAEWITVNLSPSVSYFVVTQSFDGGKTFLQPYLVPASAKSVQIQDVPPGEFGLLVQALHANGDKTKGMFAHMNVGSPMTATVVDPDPTPAPPAQVDAGMDMSEMETVKTVDPDDLTDSGVGLGLVSTMLLGSALGVRRVRRKTRSANA